MLSNSVVIVCAFVLTYIYIIHYHFVCCAGTLLFLDEVVYYYFPVYVFSGNMEIIIIVIFSRMKISVNG